MLIRPLTLDSATALHSLRILVDADGTLGPASERLRALTQESIEERLRSPYETFGAFEGDNLVGSAALCPMPEDPFDPDEKGWFALSAVIVHPDFRSRGMGRALVECCLARAHQHAARGVFLVVNVPNPSAEALYESVGFEFWAVEKGAYEHNGQRIDIVTMRRLLNVA